MNELMAQSETLLSMLASSEASQPSPTDYPAAIPIDRSVKGNLFCLCGSG